ncbi:2TM domain-containing protein [Flavobacterium sp.]|uniref:2TM domain-containing protein n=1 Tax=Flavobacterium sp. TaxID=239 RepID=UPI0039E29CA5
MELEQHEQYEYARKRILQKKYLYYHFVVLVLGSLAMFAANHFMHIGEPHQWYKLGISAWVFIFILHFINVYITNRFMNKNWERQQIERLIARQQNRIKALENKLEDDLKK